MTKTFRFQALGLVASMGLGALLISGCNPEEPAKPAALRFSGTFQAARAWQDGTEARPCPHHSQARFEKK